MTKSHLLGLYRTKTNHIVLTYASMVLWSYPDMPRVYREVYSEIEPSFADRPDVLIDASCVIEDNVALRIATEELFESSHRAAIKELFPLTKLYCHDTGQLAALKAQPWYQFWRILRNCWSHDLRFNFNPHERSMLPITWSEVTIDETMNVQPLTHGQCSREKLRELLGVAEVFVRDELA